MANLINVRLNKGDSSSLGFRLHGGKDFGTPLVIQKVIGGSPADRAGLMAGDSVCRINNVDVNNLRHKDAQDVILRAGPSFEVAVQRGGSSWKPTVTPVGKIPSPRPTSHVNNLSPVTSTSLAAGRQENIGAIGTSHNLAARPFGGQVNGGPQLVNKQYNSPLPIYSDRSIAETLSAQSEVLSNGVLGVNFKKNEKSYDSEKSAVFRMVQEAENDPRDESEIDYSPSSGVITAPIGIAGLRRVQAPENKPAPSTPQLPPGQNICADCERLIVGVFVRIKDKNLHVECFKCSTCGSSLKNVGYYNLNNKLYCDVHAKLAAKNNPPGPNLQPITIPPGGKIPAGTISAALSSHSLPSPAPLSPSTNYSATPFYTPGNLSSPRPFSTVSAPLSPSNTFRRTSPTPAAPLAENRCVQNTVWPPIQSEPDFPTASPLYFPPPSQVEPIIKKQQQRLEEDSYEIENLDIVELEEMNNQNINWYSAEVSNITGRSTAQCTETLSDLINTQLLVDSVMQSRPSSDVSVTFTISEAQLKHGRSCSTLSNSSVCETTQSTNVKQSISSEQEFKSAAISQNQQEQNCSDLCETVCQENKTCLLKGQQQICEQNVKIENAVPHKWESPMVVALTVASDKPYAQSEIDSSECFSQIPTKKSTSALASALATAPSEPFNPTKFSSLEVIPLPEETVPYFPPERSIISESTTEQTSQSKPTVSKKQSKIDEELFKDLPERPTERISLLAALTTAPDRPYSPFSGDVPSYQTEETQLEATRDTESGKLKQITATTTNNQKKSIQSNIQSTQASVSQQKMLNKKDEIKLSSTQMEKVNKSVTFSEHHKKEKESHSQETSSKSQSISKNVQSENVSKVSTGLPPMIQMVRSSFESKNDKVQMEMSCQFLGEPVTTQITEKCLTQSNIVEDRATEKSKKSRSSEYEKQSKTSNESIEKCNLKSDSKFSSVGSVSNKESNTSLISESALLQKATNKAKSIVDSKQIVEKIDRNVSSIAAKQSSNVNQQGEMLSKQRVTTVQPGVENVNIPQISFQRVLDEISSNTTSSSRPRSTTPIVISNPPPIIPYYQASIAPMDCRPVGSNLLNPASPCKSRSPSPCFGRPASPFHTTTIRPVSPAAGPPPNPLRTNTSLSETMYDDRVRDAKSHLQKFIPQHQQKMQAHQSQSMANIMSQSLSATENISQQSSLACNSSNKHVANLERKGVQFASDVQMHAHQSQSMSSVMSQGFSGTENKSQQSLSASSNKHTSNLENKGVQFRSENKNVEVSTCGNIQTQTTKTVSEQYERSQKSCSLQSEKSSRKVVMQSSDNANLHTTENQNVVGFHITNPQPLKSPFLSIGDQSNPTNVESSQNNIPKKHLIPDSSPSKLPKPIVPCSGTVPTNSASSIKTVTTPSVSQPNVGAGGGRQAGAVGVAPRRGRGILNLAAAPGSRVALCGQCHSHIRGPFITALGKIWCPDHFVCATPSCRRPLQDLGFVEERGQLYCEYCFEQYLAPPCSKCNAKIKGDCLKAIGKNFHPECFNCVYCGKLFGNSPFFLEDCQPYCENDWNELFTTKCFACGFPVEAGDRWVEALSNNYHSQCFNCTMCKKNLEGQSFVAKGGRPFCKNHAR